MKTKKNKQGISLIVMVISIIVMLILAGAVIISVNNTGILGRAEKATFDTKVAAYQEELGLAILEGNLETTGERTDKFTASGYDEVKKIIPSFKKEDENIFAVSDDKLIYIGKDAETYKLALEKGLLPEGELLDDEILTELQPFITEWTVEAGDSITLPISSHPYFNDYDFTVDYGDGTEIKHITSATSEDRIHTYENAGTYTVTIKGKCSGFLFSFVNTSKDKITKIVQWGNVFYGKSYTGVDFAKCVNLQGEIPTPSKNSFAKMTYQNWNTGMFDGCSGLTGEIPKNLFANCTNVNDFPYVFRGCTGLTGSIPEGLFANCTKVTSFRDAFSGCTGLTGSIPEDLFKNCTSVTTFLNTFAGCSGLTGSIPENLFADCTKVTIFSSVFKNCTGLTGSIPEGLFKQAPGVTAFTSTFDGCSGLTGDIPEKLFWYNTEATNFYRTFYKCNGLDGTISENMFDNNLKIKDVCYLFAGCSQLKGTAPKLWEREEITSHISCFVNCKKLSNYSEIPSDWK